LHCENFLLSRLRNFATFPLTRTAARKLKRPFRAWVALIPIHARPTARIIFAGLCSEALAAGLAFVFTLWSSLRDAIA